MYDIFEQLLQKNKITAYKVAKETGISQTALSNWKNGKSIPSLRSLKKIADFFGVSVDYLTSGQDRNSSSDNPLDNENTEIVQDFLGNENLRALFNTAKNASPDDLKIINIILIFLEKKGYDNTVRDENDSYKRYCKIRDGLGYKDATVAREIGVTKSTFSDWKAGKYTPKREKMSKIANFLSVSVDYLMTGENGTSPEGYYINKEIAEIAQQLFENRDLHLLFDAAKDASSDDLKTIYDMLMALKKKEQTSGE